MLRTCDGIILLSPFLRIIFFLSIYVLLETLFKSPEINKFWERINKLKPARVETEMSSEDILKEHDRQRLNL